MNLHVRTCMYLFALVTLVSLFALRIQAQDVQTRPATAILDVAWSPDGSKLARVLANGQVQVLNPTTQSSLFDFLPSPNLTLFDASLDWSSDGERLALGIGNTVYIWNATTSQIEQSFLVGEMNGVFASEFGNIAEGIVTLEWDSSNQQLLIETESVRLIILAYPSGNVLYNQVIGNVAGSLYWLPDNTSVSTGQRVFDLESQTVSYLEAGRPYSRPSDMGTATSLTVNNSEEKVAVGTLNGYIEIIDPFTGAAFNRFHYTEAHISDLAWSNDDSHLISVDRDGKIHDLNLITGTAALVTQLDGIIYAVDLNPNTQQVALGGVSNTGETLFQIIEIPSLVYPNLSTVILSPTLANPLTLSEETRAWYNYTLSLSAALTGSDSVTVRLDYYPPTPSNYAHLQTKPATMSTWSTAQTLVFDANHTEYEVRIRARDDSTNLTGAVGRLSHRITASNVAGYPVNTVDASGMRLTGSPFSGGNDASAAADSRNVLVFTVEDND